MYIARIQSAWQLRSCFLYICFSIPSIKFSSLASRAKSKYSYKPKFWCFYCSCNEQENANYSHIKFEPKGRKDIRRCLITRRVLPKDQLWRIVRTRDDSGKYKVQLDAGKGRTG
ncbi:hypothetical protein Gasu2_14220 [Galdieria sulphuraria]|nr:hypothetical protein Gasu2_14220 [Galdieria sulphuraria]